MNEIEIEIGGVFKRNNGKTYICEEYLDEPQSYPAGIYHPIGTVFSLLGKKFEVRENKESCEGCGFFPPELELACASHRCSQSHRPDKTTVIFYELESEIEEKKMEGKSVEKEYAIGEVFTDSKGNTFKVFEAEDGTVEFCKKCAFDVEFDGCLRYACCSAFREDGKSAFFVKHETINDDSRFS